MRGSAALLAHVAPARQQVPRSPRRPQPQPQRPSQPAPRPSCPRRRPQRARSRLQLRRRRARPPLLHRPRSAQAV
jgi:hypothetical protein